MTTATEQRATLLRLEAEALAERQQTTTEIIRAYIDDRPVDFREMQRVGLTTSQLDSAKAIVLERRKLRAAMDLIPAAEAVVAQRTSEIAELVRQRNESVAEFDRQILVLEADQESNRRLVSSGNEARRTLIRECKNHRALDALNAIDGQIERARRELVEKQTIRGQKMDAFSSCRGHMDEPGVSQRAQRLNGELQVIDAERARLEKTIGELQQERKAAEDQYLCDPDLV